MIELNELPKSMRIKAVRRVDTIELSYSFDAKDYKMMRIASFPDNIPVMVGMAVASPDGDGFNALFEDFKVTQLPDARRLKWLDNNK